MVWLLGIRDRSKELPASRCKCLLGSVPTVSTFSKDNDAKKYRHWRLEVERGIYLYSFCLFVCCSLLSALFCFPSFLPSLFFFVTDFVSVLPSGTNSYSLFLARKKMDDNNSGGGGGGWF